MKRRMVGRRLLLGAVAYGTAVLAASMADAHVARAQEIAANTRIANVADEPLARPVTMSVTRVPLKQALHVAAASARVTVQFREPVIDAYCTPVTLQAKGQPLRVVLDQLLANTTLRVVPDGSTRLAIVDLRDEAPREPVQTPLVGKVLDAKTRAPIVRATLTIGDATKGMLTNEDGTFRLTVAPGTYTITARAVGYTRYSKSVTVKSDDLTALELLMTPSTSLLDEVIVTGTVVATERKAIATPITVITAKDIEQRGITRIEQLMRGEIPGVVALDFGTSNYQTANGFGHMQRSLIYARGTASLDGGANPIKTYVDGVELLDPSYLGTIDPKSIERIEVVTGPQAATIYGSGAMGGVMQIFTKKGHASARPDVAVSLRYGMLENNISDGHTPSHSHSLTVAGGDGPAFSYSTTLSYNYTGQWQPDLFARNYGAQLGLNRVQGPVSASGSFSMTAGQNGTPSGIGGVWTNYGQSPLERALLASGELWQQNYGGFSGQKRATSVAQTIGVDVNYRATDFWQHHVTIGRSQNEFEYEPLRPGYQIPADTLYYGAGSSGRRVTLGYNTTLTNAFGAVSSSFTLGANGSWGNQSTFRASLASSSATSYLNPSLQRALDSKSWGGFGSWQVGFFDRFFVTLGLRGERNPNYGRDHTVDWTPTSGAAYTIETGDLTVKFLGSYGSATRPPDPTYRLEERSRVDGYEPSMYISRLESPDLRPERSRGPQGGIEVYYGNVGSLTINRYKQIVADLIQAIAIDSTLLVSTTGPYQFYGYTNQYLNTAKIQQSGWEFVGTANLGVLSLKGTYSWNDSKVISSNPLSYYTTSGVVGQIFDRIPRHTANIVATYAHGGSNVSLVTNFVGGSRSYGFAGLGYLLMNYSRLSMYIDNKRGLGSDYMSPAYAKTDLAVSQRITNGITATMNVTNLFNKFVSDVGSRSYFPTLGRQALFGISLRR